MNEGVTQQSAGAKGESEVFQGNILPCGMIGEEELVNPLGVERLDG
jgi:hypothetical protein